VVTEEEFKQILSKAQSHSVFWFSEAFEQNEVDHRDYRDFMIEHLRRIHSEKPQVREILDKTIKTVEQQIHKLKNYFD